MAPKLPLLLLPRPAKADATRPRGSEKRRKVDRGAQGRRLSEAFERIDKTLKELRLDPSGAPPEKILVLETTKTAPKFRDALQAAVDADPRLTWLLDAPLDDLAEEVGEDLGEDLRKDGPQDRPWRLYLVMANRRGASELVEKFRGYRGSFQKAAPFAPPGKVPAAWTHLFDALVDIRFWGLRDRLIDNRTLDHWREELELQPRMLRFEIELWWRPPGEKRQEAVERLRQLVSIAGGRVVDGPCIIDAIRYCGLLVEVPSASLEVILPAIASARDPEVVELPHDMALLECDEVMFFRPRVQGDVAVMLEDSRESVGPVPGRPRGEPIVALLDGVPLENHVRLADRIIVHDPDELASQSMAAHRVHGTAMASLIVHGDLQGSGAPLERPLLIRPIMQSRTLPDGRMREELPEDRLALDTFHRAVSQLLEHDVAPSVRVINVSLGDHTRLFDGAGPSPWARLVDHLAYEHRLLFVISAGNCTRALAIDGDPATLRQQIQAGDPQLGRNVLRSMHRDLAHRKLRSPSESINAITVGALHEDEGQPMAARGYVFDPMPQPRTLGPMTSFGLGVRRSVKPDLVVAGGRQPLREPPSSKPDERLYLRLVEGAAVPLGHRVAAPGCAGQRDGAIFSRGTSNAAALTSRGAAQLHEVLEELRRQHRERAPAPAYDAVLLKAMLVHGACWPEEIVEWERVVEEGSAPKRDLRDEKARAYGYGNPDFERVMRCTATRATGMGVGELGDGEALVFRFPLPECLGTRTTRRRLIITLAYLSPIHAGHQRYRRARLWFEHGAGGVLGVKSCDVKTETAMRGTLEHLVLQGEGTAVDPTRSQIELKVSCRADAGELSSAVPFALLVTLEVGEGETLPIYQQVAQRLRARARARP